MAKPICPVCKSRSSRVRMPQGGVTFAWDRKCRECGSIWQPACPKWAAWMFVGIGLVIGAVGYAVAGWEPQLGVVALCVVVVAKPLIVYGLAVVAGQCGQLRILHQGRGPDAFACPRCGETVSKQADSCPNCGHVWRGGKSRRIDKKMELLETAEVRPFPPWLQAPQPRPCEQDVWYQLGRVLGQGIGYMVTCLKGLYKVVFQKSHRNPPGGP